MKYICPTTRAWVEIDTAALLHNCDTVRALLPPTTALMAVIKADAYGHGALRVAELLSDRVDCYGVASADEAIELRRNGIENDIVILGGTSEEMFPFLLEYDIMPTIFTEKAAKALSEAAGEGKASLFLAVDTGMTRIGFPDDEVGCEAIREIVLDSHLNVCGLFSHFACADEADTTSAERQLARYRTFTEHLAAEGINIGARSLDNSAGLLSLDAAFDMVRTGIVLYGVHPSGEVAKRLPLRQVLSLRARVKLVKAVPPGVGVSYGHRYVTSRETRIATLAIGYADGVPRLLSEKGSVLIRGKRARILGRICMDQMMVDVTEIDDVKEGDIATVLGCDGEEKITADEIALHAATIPYEILCSFSRPRLPKIYQ